MMKNKLDDEQKREYLEELKEKIVVIPNGDKFHDIEVYFKVPIINDKRIRDEKGDIKKGWKIQLS